MLAFILFYVAELFGHCRQVVSPILVAQRWEEDLSSVERMTHTVPQLSVLDALIILKSIYEE